MTTGPRCEDRVEGRPLRVASGFPCPNSARYAIRDPATGGRLYVCGVHRRVRARWGWVDADPATCGVCGATVAGAGRPMREHVAAEHPERYPDYIDVETGERL